MLAFMHRQTTEAQKQDLLHPARADAVDWEMVRICSLHVLEESARTFSGIETVRAVVWEIVARCLEAGLVQGDNVSVDGSFVEANANTGSRIPREEF